MQRRARNERMGFMVAGYCTNVTVCGVRLMRSNAFDARENAWRWNRKLKMVLWAPTHMYGVPICTIKRSNFDIKWLDGSS